MATRQKRLSSSKRSAPISRFKQFGDAKQFTIKEKYNRSMVLARKRPFATFLITLVVLFLVILLGSTLFRVKTPSPATRTAPKDVSVYNMGGAPRVSVQGQVMKGGVVKIIAQAPGIVSYINAQDGASVYKGAVLINLASNYQGGNIFSLQRQIADTTFQNTKDSYPLQKDLIQKQRDLANKQADNSEELRKLAQISANDTRDLLNFNTNILNGVITNIQMLQAANGNPADIQALQQLQSQIQGGNNQLSASLRANEYQVNLDKPANQLVNIGKDIAFKQIEIQEKALNMGLEIAEIQSKLARVQESTMYPAAPFNAVVQKVHVKIGDSVNPGTPLITLSGDEGDIVIDAKVPKEMAIKISKIEKATIFADGKKIDIVPSYISTEATSGQLYSVLFTLDAAYKKFFTDNSYVTVSLPLGQTMQNTTPFVPVDSVFQTQDEAFVFIAENNKAKSRKVKLGTVTGGYVTIEEGLSASDQVILDRTVVDGDAVRIQN